MSAVRPIPKEDLQDFISIVTNAYPALELGSAEARNRALDQLEESYIDESRQLFGLYRGGKLLGGMFLHDFDMQIHTDLVKTGGIGLVAVHLLHKKEKVAKELIQFSIDFYRQRSAPLISLYPFKPEFYKRMGFGYGPKISQYRALPSALPGGSKKDKIRFVDESDGPNLARCYDRYARSTHGMILRSLKDIERLLFDSGAVVIAYFEEEEVKGYLAFSFEKGETFLQNDLQVKEIIYDQPQVLGQLLTFLHTQLDQVRRTVFNIHNKDFHHLLEDPTNNTGNLIPFVYHETNTQGMGLMYRVVDLPLLFKSIERHNFSSQTVRLGIRIKDSLFPENDGSYVFKFLGGEAVYDPLAEPEVIIGLDIADFSSLFMGTISFESQYLFGLADISDPNCVQVVNKLFSVEREPVCMTHF